jgi:hypothetical protein
MNPHIFSNRNCIRIKLYQDQDPHPDSHQSDKLDPDPDPDPHQFETSQNVWNMSLFEHFFKGLGLSLEARIWILLRIRNK